MRVAIEEEETKQNKKEQVLVTIWDFLGITAKIVKQLSSPGKQCGDSSTGQR